MEMDNIDRRHDDIDENIQDDYEYDFEVINKEYDIYIDHLHRRLQIMKDDRRKAELETETLKNRVILLQTQEKAALQKFQRTKWQIDQILQNRKYFHREDNRTKTWKENTKKESDELKEKVKKMRLSRSVLMNKIKKQDDRFIKSQTFDKKNADNLKIMLADNKIKEKLDDPIIQKQILDQKSKFKDDIKKKIEKAELEKKNLEKLLAQVEKQEIHIIKNFKINSKHMRLHSQSVDFGKF